MTLLRLLFVALVCLLLVLPLVPLEGQLFTCEDCYTTGTPNGQPLNPGAATFPVICCFDFQDCSGSGYEYESGPYIGCSVVWDGGLNKYRCAGDTSGSCEGGGGPGGGTGHCTIRLGELCPAECQICWTQLY
jgi:hypothetical protein